MREKIEISKINVSETSRKIDPKKVDEIAESIKEVGLLQPIGIDQNNTLVFGQHRLEACKKLGWKEIDYVRVFQNNPLKVAISQIDENLMRRELTHLQRAEHIQRRRELYEKLHPEQKPDTLQAQADTLPQQLTLPDVVNLSPNLTIPQPILDDTKPVEVDKEFIPSERKTKLIPQIPQKKRGRKSGTPNKEFNEEIKRLGITDDIIKQSLFIARCILPEVKEVLHSHPLSKNMQALLEIAKMSNATQRKLIPFIRSGQMMDVIALRRFRKAKIVEEFERQLEQTTYYSVIVLRPPFMLMPPADIAMLDLKADRNAVMFVFADEFNFNTCMRLVSNFGFEYRRLLVIMHKAKEEQWFNNACRFVIMAVRGNPSIMKSEERTFTNILANEAQFYSLINSLVPSTYKKVEFFPPSHLRERPDWSSVNFGSISIDPEDIELEVLPERKEEE